MKHFLCNKSLLINLVQIFSNSSWRSFLTAIYGKALSQYQKLLFFGRSFYPRFLIKALIQTFQALNSKLLLLIEQIIYCKNSRAKFDAVEIKFFYFDRIIRIHHKTYAKLYPSIPILSFSYFRMVASESLLDCRDCLESCWGGAAKAVAITKANTIRNFIF